MLFNSYIFILFFLPVTVAVYFLINKYNKKDNGKWDLWWLFLMSLWFYGYSNPVYLLLILFSIIINYFITGHIGKMRREQKKKTARNWMIAGIVFNLALLFYFKYYDFFISNMNVIFKQDWALKNIALPLGISFFTFQQLSYVVDCYREKVSIQYKFIEYAAYVTFFPQLVAGPIVMHSELVPQMKDKTKKKLDFNNLSLGLYALASGLGKKVLLADNLSKIVSLGYGDIGGLNRSSALVVMVSYMLQIYFDFSGYCDMALGMSKMFNIDLPINFNSPYKARTLGEFWDRWHLTLGRFFVQYVYIPLGGSRKGRVRTYLNNFAVFFLSGFWHGANWTFFIWGIIHGTCSTIERVVREVHGKFIKKKEGFTYPEWIKWIGDIAGKIYMFVFYNVTLVIFRADSVSDAKLFFSRLGVSEGGISAQIVEKVNELVEIRLLYRLGLKGIISAYPQLPCIAILIILLAAVYFLKNTQEKMAMEKYGALRSVFIVFLLVWSIISLSDVSEFLYFNF